MFDRYRFNELPDADGRFADTRRGEERVVRVDGHYDMRLLLLSHYYPPEMGGCGSRMHGLAKWLVRSGHEVTVITGFPNYPAGKIDKQYRGKWTATDELDGVRIIYSWIYASPESGKLPRLMNYFSFVFSSMVAGVFLRQPFDVIVATSPPLFLGLSGWMISRLRRRPWILDIRDIWPDVAVEAGEFKPNSFMVRWGSRLERFLYRRATHITVVTNAKRENLGRKSVPAPKISVVENGVDLDVLQRVSEDCQAGSPFRSEHGLEGKFLVSYAGLFGVFQGLDVVLAAARQLLEESDVHFVMVGEGVKRAELLAYADDHGLHNVTFLPLQPRDKLLPLIHESDAMLVPLVNEQLVDAVPSKLLEAWGCGKGVIYIGSGEAESLVRECEGGIVIAPGSPTKIADAIRDMRHGVLDYLPWGERGHQFVKQRFERSILARKIESVCRKLCSSGNKHGSSE